MVTYVLAIFLIAFVFDFINGFHDSANSIATIVGTRVLSPFAAVVWAAVFNFAAILGGTAVAKAVATGFIDNNIVEPNVMPSSPALASAAPASPPMSACEELDGMP